MAEHDPAPARDPAMGRYMALHLVRLACIFVVMFGLLIQENRIEGPALLGFALLVVGALGFFFLPHTLAKRWKSRDE